jgi:hypothetical protein
MGRALRRGVVFTALFFGLVAPAQADPVLMFLFSVAREMVLSHINSPNKASAPEFLPDFGKVYPGTSVEPDVLRKLIDDSFLYLSSNQRGEIFEALNAHLLNPRNAAVRGAMIEYFAERALAIRAAQLQLAKMPYTEKQRIAAEFKAELLSLRPEDQAELRGLLKSGLLPVPGDLNQLLLAAFDPR